MVCYLEHRRTKRYYGLLHSESRYSLLTFCQASLSSKPTSGYRAIDFIPIEISTRFDGFWKIDATSFGPSSYCMVLVEGASIGWNRILLFIAMSMVVAYAVFAKIRVTLTQVAWSVFNEDLCDNKVVTWSDGQSEGKGYRILFLSF